MGDIRLAILGGGSVRCTPKVVAALATYFGERPLEIVMWDSDGERLDLFDRFARYLFLMTSTPHRLISTTDPYEALQGADAVIFQVGVNCARKHRGKRYESDVE